MKMKSVLLVGLFFLTLNHAFADVARGVIGPVPVTQYGGKVVAQRLATVRRAILKDEAGCKTLAETEGSVSAYQAAIQKLADTAHFVSIEVTSSSECGGAHPNGYQYGMTFDTTSGVRINVNKLYSLGIEANGSLALSDAGAQLVHDKFLAINAKTPDCADPKEFDLNFFKAYPYSEAIDNKGALHIYLAVPYAQFSCVGPIILQPEDLKSFANKSELSKLGLR